MPSIVSSVEAYLNKRHPGDADTITRHIFFYILLYLITIGPFHLLNRVYGYKVYQIPQKNKHLEPIILPGDMVVFDRSAYGLVNAHPELISVGDLIFHKKIAGDFMTNTNVHWVLASPGDTLMAQNSVITINNRPLKIPIKTPYSGNPNFGPIIVPEGQIFVVDNSWQMFPLYVKSIVGKATMVLWSRKHGVAFRTERFGKSIDHVSILDSLR